MRQKPINTDKNDSALTIVSGYYKFGWETIIGKKFGVTGCAVMVIYELKENRIIQQ